jgi:hypothetical protein
VNIDLNFIKNDQPICSGLEVRTNVQLGETFEQCLTRCENSPFFPAVLSSGCRAGCMVNAIFPPISPEDESMNPSDNV